MEKKYILVLGAGLMQRPSLEAAKELGYKTLVVDANPNAICVPFADRFEPIDLKDKEAIADFALSMKDSIAAVFTAGTDFSASVSYVAEKLGLVSHNYEAALNASNKARMRRCFEKHGVPSPDFCEMTERDLAELSEEKLQKIEFPKVIKPVDNMGARGCRLVRNREEFISGLKSAIRFSRTGTAIVEDYMEGREYSIDALVVDSKVIITGFADRHIFFEPYFIELGHTMPSSASDSEKAELCAVFAQGVKALGLTDGVAKGDIKYTKNGPMIGEIAGRLSGGYMSGWTFPYASEVNLTKEAMKISLGEGTCYAGKNEIECKNFSYERAFISIPGTVEEIYGDESVEGIPFVKNLFFRTKKGDKVVFPRNNVEKCGNVITCSKNRELALEAAERAVASVVIRLKAENSETQKFLEGYEDSDEKGFPYSAFSLDEEEQKKLEEELKNLAVEKICSSDDAEKYVPPVLASMKKRDFNYRSISGSLAFFRKYGKITSPLNAVEFYRYLVRGGIQGILYLADNAGEGK